MNQITKKMWLRTRNNKLDHFSFLHLLTYWLPNIYQCKLYSISKWIPEAKCCFYPNILINWTFYWRYQITFSKNAVSIWIRFCMSITDDENSLDKFGSERLLLFMWLCKLLWKCFHPINYPPNRYFMHY